MKLNIECIRDILLTIEDYGGLNHGITLPNNDYDRLKTYSNEEVLYHVRQCEMSELIFGVHKYLGNGCSILDLTPAGHEFIANVRKDTIWNEVKEKSSKIGVASLKALIQIASSVVSNMINSHL